MKTMGEKLFSIWLPVAALQKCEKFPIVHYTYITACIEYIVK